MIGGLFVVAAIIAVGGWAFTRPPAGTVPEAAAESPVMAEPGRAELPPPPPPPNPDDEAARAAAQAAAMAEPLEPEEATVAAAEPKAVAPKAAEPKAAEPKAAEPKAAEPKAAAPASGGNARTLTDAGWKAIDGGDVTGAHGLFARALQKDPGSAWALYGRGYANEKLGDTVSASADYCAARGRSGADTELQRELDGGLRRLGAGC